LKDTIHSKPIDMPEAAQLTGAAVALGLHYFGSQEMSAEMLGASWTALILPLIMLALRVIKRWLNPPPPSTGIGVRAGALVLMLLAGCSSHYTLREGGWVLDTDPRHPEGSCLHVYGDGDDDVMRVCIKDPEPVKVMPDVLVPLCKQLPQFSGGE
jgi:hypothetical protein